ncbi:MULTISPECIES: hypothetical protein [Caulobacter]|uniref:hypothetical protein n=1 Tax=Caulobacter TaxID=75 RepID=UPI0013049A0B|nr:MULTISPECIES: hypothetical protein [Caulobacter]
MCELTQQLRRQGGHDLVDRRGGPLSIAFGFVAQFFQGDHALFERLIGRVDRALLD